MKVGLLICDHVRPEYLHIGGTHPDIFRNFLPDLDLEVFFVCDNQFPDRVEDCDAYLVSGSSFSVYEEEAWIIRLRAFVREIYDAKIPYVGVCFGHQLLGESLGGKVEKASVGWCVGVHEFRIDQKASWMEPSAQKVNLIMLCQDQITTLPPDTKVLASSDKCPYGMIQVGEFMFGVQAHPEFSKAYIEALMRSRVERIGASVVEEGIESLKLPVSQDVLRAWVKGFLATK